METDINAFLANIWFGIIGLLLMLYVILDGFDLGVGVLSLFEKSEERRGILMGSLGSVWDGNETWLVLLGGSLFGAFPIVYGTVLHGLYVPAMVMLFALIFRGVAFEFRENARDKRPWNLAFGGGSLVAAAAQGFALGGLIEGLPVSARGTFGGHVLDWFSGFSCLVALGVVFGYTLLGATYLVMRTTGSIQRRAYTGAWIAASLMFVVAIGVTVWTPLIHPRVASRWFELPSFFYYLPLPGIAAIAFLMLLRALRRRFETAPFAWSVVIFIASFLGLAISLFPYIVPGSLTIYQTASASNTLIFMLTGIGTMIPVMMIYNGYQYIVFRGKVTTGYGED